MSAMRNRKKWKCKDCLVDTGKISEHFYLNDNIWMKINNIKDWQIGMLCVGCCEKRLGRRLNSGDFTDAWINNPKMVPSMSARLIDRINNQS